MSGDQTFWWWWAIGREPESYHGPCETRDEAIATARGDDGDKYGFTIVEADRTVPSMKIFDGGRVLEDYDEHNCECWGEDGADLDVTGEQERDLEAMLAEALEAWFTKHGIKRNGWAFDTMRNEQYFEPTQSETV